MNSLSHNSPNISKLPPLREMLDRYGIRAKKSFGQNFLLDLNLTDRIARAAIGRAAGDLSERVVFEVGAGPAGLTRALLSHGAEVIAIEHDPRFINLLNEVRDNSEGMLKIIQGDALTVDENALFCNEKKPVKIVANLPYNIATVLLFKWLDNIHLFESMTLMFQKEVADRIVATKNTKAYGRLSVMTQALCDVKKEFDVNPNAFVPPPKVTSSIVTFIPKKNQINKKNLEKICKVAFGQRRKTLRSSLKNTISEEDIKKVGIDPNLRPEDLSVQEFIELSNYK